MSSLAGKVALITGGARGMGESHARVMLGEGAQVVIGDIDDEAGRMLAEELGPDARYVHLDVTSPVDWRTAVDQTVAEFGSLSVLVNNAGILNHGSIDEYTLEQWNAIMSVNVTGTFLGISAAVDALRASAPSSVINMSSADGLIGSVGRFGYTASKFAITGLTKSLALELASDGVRVNSVHPGGVRTGMTGGIDEKAAPWAMRRFADPTEISALVAYLASDRSSFSTGSSFVADGGLTAGAASTPPSSGVNGPVAVMPAGRAS